MQTLTLDTFARDSATAIREQLYASNIIMATKKGPDTWTPGHYRLVGVNDGPRTVNFYLDVRRIHLSRVVSVLLGLTNKPTMQTAVRSAGRLNDSLPVRLSDGPNGTLSIEVGKPEHLWVYPGVDWPGFGGQAFDVPVGLMSDGRPARLDFADPNTPAAMVAGLPGSGKTNAYLNLVYQICKQNPVDQIGFMFIDASPKNGSDFEPIKRLACRVADPVTDPDESVAALRWASTKLDGSDNRRLFIIIEEATDLVNQRPESADILASLGRGGRAAGVHIIQVFHNPTVASTGKRDVSAMIPARLVGRVMDQTASRVAVGQPGKGAENLTGKGDMLFVSPSQNLVRVIVPLLKESDLTGLPTRERVDGLNLGDWDEPVRPTGGRIPDPIEPHLVGKLVDHIAKRQRQGLGPLSGSSLGKKWGDLTGTLMRAEKMERHLAWANGVLEGIKEGSKEFE